ncbi:katanin p80 WD40 repeat-containing subunit B1-like [Saimiri boliviensis]|uniref:katanin p80 WD40 repeat-containing subunit B1-like n=1 Tax=Saimiri boliviensis TaxID=27679 RepID=UPI003D784DB3
MAKGDPQETERRDVCVCLLYADVQSRTPEKPRGQIHNPGISIGGVAKKLSAVGNNLSGSARQPDVTEAENRSKPGLTTGGEGRESKYYHLSSASCLISGAIRSSQEPEPCCKLQSSPFASFPHVATAKEAAKPSPAMDVQFPVPNLEVLPRPPVVTSTPARAPKAEPAIISATRNEPIGLKASDFLPAVKIPLQAELVDDDAMSQIRKGHDTMCVVLTSRHKHLDAVRAVWTTGDIKTSVDSAVAINDLSVVVDLLNIVNQKASLWKLDLCTTVLPQIEKLLQNKYERCVWGSHACLEEGEGRGKKPPGPREGPPMAWVFL